MRITFMRPALMTAAIVASAGILAGGLALRPAFAVGGSAIVGPFTVTHCSQSAPCKTYSNARTGPGLRGINTSSSPNGSGLIGTATANGTGVTGQGSVGPGVLGTSSTGVGVAGASTSSIGVLGNSNSFNGVEGISTSSDTSNAGVQGDNNSSTIAVRANGFGGPLFVGNGSGGVDVFTVDNGGNVGVGGGETVTGISGEDALDVGSAAPSRGVVGAGSTVGVAGYALGAFGAGLFGVADSSNAGALQVQDLTNNGALIDGFDSGSILKFQVQDDGSVLAHQFVDAFDSPRGQRVTSYATMSTTANIEDFGEAQLTGGHAYVSLKDAYAAAIDSRYTYMVFITPEGDTRGLYVTQKTPAGFVVRENQGGRSDATFSYRIVAKPFGSTTVALRPSIAPSHQLPHRATLHSVPKSKPKAP